MAKQGQTARPQSGNALEEIAGAARTAGRRGLPPVHLWNPPFCGDLDIRIARDGTWFYLGTPIGRPALVRLFSTVLKREDDKYFLVTPVEKVGIRVDDTPFLAVEMRREDSAAGAVLLGASLGAVWAPCAGPVLGSILTLIASSQRLDHAALLLSAYSIGAAVPMLLIGYGGQIVSTRLRHVMRHTRALQQGFGMVIVLVAIATFYQVDTVITAWLANFYPSISGGL